MNPAEITLHSLDSYCSEATAEIAASNRRAMIALRTASNRRAMIALRTADAIIKNIYANNVGKLAAWLSTSHVERAPKPKAPPTT